MPEDGNGSGVVALLWGLWVYGLFTFWFERFSSLAKAKTAQRSGRAISPVSVSARCAELEAMASGVLKRCGGLTVIDFLNERLAAYEAVVAAFNAGDQATLLRYVSPELYVKFSDAIVAKEGRCEKAKTVFALVASPEIVAARMDDAHAEISIRFVASSYKLPEGGQGTPEERRSVDIWTFGCTPPTHRWSLIATEAGR